MQKKCINVVKQTLQSRSGKILKTYRKAKNMQKKMQTSGKYADF